MVVEWNLSTGQGVESNLYSSIVKQIWSRSCWYLGGVLAGLSYLLLADEIFRDFFFVPASTPPWGLLWLLTPLSLTDIGSRNWRSHTGDQQRNSFSPALLRQSLMKTGLSVDTTELDSDSIAQRRLNSRETSVFWWSAIALILAQGLTLFQADIRLIGLGVATFVMFINSFYLQQPLAAGITMGFSLGFGAAGLGQGVAGFPLESVANWYGVSAIACLGLWLLQAGLRRQSSRLAQLYAQACDRWAICLSTMGLGVLTLQTANCYLELIPPSWQYLMASILFGGAMGYRYWQSFPKLSIYGISWAIELTLANSIILLNGSSLLLGAANIILALGVFGFHHYGLTRLVEDDGQTVELGQDTSRREPGKRRRNWQAVLESLPLAYALIGMNLRFAYFTPYTGLLTVGTALTGMILGRRFRGKGITYLFLAGISLAWYEFVIYTLIGISLHFFYFTPYTGFITLGAALVGISVAYYRPKATGIIYLSLAGISLAGYELVIYQLLRTDGGNPRDSFIILAIIAALICCIYRLLVWFLRWQSLFLQNVSRDRTKLFYIPVTQLEMTAHIHWAISSILMVIAAGMSVGTPANLMGILGLFLCVFLASYALFQGNLPVQQRLFSVPSSRRTQRQALIWIYAGLTEVVAIGIYGRLMWTGLSLFDPWRSIVACLFAIALYQIPWRRWGWTDQPWQRYASVLPLLSVLINPQTLSTPNLLTLAGFYFWVTYRQSNLRWTYLSLGFIDWAIWQILHNQTVAEPLAYAVGIGYFFLYVAQVDPELSQRRNWRHALRVLGLGIIGLIGLGFYQNMPLIPGLISLVAIVAGFRWQIRAFLLVGLMTMSGTIVYQLVIFRVNPLFFNWGMGLIAGLVLISIIVILVKQWEPMINWVQDWIVQWREWE